MLLIKLPFSYHPSNEYPSYYEPAIGKDLSIITRGQYQYTYKIGKLVGIASSPDVNRAYIMGSNYNKNITKSQNSDGSYTNSKSDNGIIVFIPFLFRVSK